VSVFIFILQGEYDAILPWPFTRKVKFILLDQKAKLSQRKNIEMILNPVQGMNESFGRPKTHANSGNGFSTFVSHEVLRNENYLVDGAIFLQVEVESCNEYN
jgi:hypothetical protein